jgi:hypothetical protein
MKFPRRRWRRSSTGSAPTELTLPPAPWLTLLIALHGVGLPLTLAFLPLRHAGLAVSGCLALALVAAPAVARVCLGWGVRAPRRLSFTPEGTFRLDLAGGFQEPVTLAARSLIAGPWWILVLEGARDRHCVVLETARVPPATLAALGRVLRRVAAGPDGAQPALRSLIDPGRPGD